MKIVADDKIPFLKGVLEPFAEVVYLPGDKIKKAQLKNADGLLTRSITQCNDELLEGTSIKLIASATIGDDHIDKEFCKRNNIKWTMAQGCNANAVVQYFTSALLCVSELSGFTLKDKTIGIIGVGNIGSKIEKVCRALGMKVLLNDPPRERREGSRNFSDLKTIQQQANIITFHVPLTFGGADKSFHLFDHTFANRLSKPVILINTSRGPVTDFEAIKYGKEQGNISHLILDVWEGESHIDTELLELVAIGTPHIAGYSIEGKAKATEMVVQSVGEFFNLPLKNWKPETDLKNIVLNIDLKGLNEQQSLQKVFQAVYAIRKDDELLSENPSDFERLRGNYVFRRENTGYILKLKNSTIETERILIDLDFRVELTI
jgi:erythronate-4-phosphate dehydrogenase